MSFDYSMDGTFALPQRTRRMSRAPSLPPLTEEQVTRLEKLFEERDLRPSPGDGPGAARMVGFVALVGLLMLAGSALLVWEPVALLAAGS